MEDALKSILNATLVVAVLGGLVALFKVWRASVQRREMAMRALFAELEHIAQHYRFSSDELEMLATPDTIRRRLVWSRYGPVASASPTALKENVLLGTQQVAEVLQLAFVIRNTDSYIDELLAQTPPFSEKDVKALIARMKRVPVHATSLADYVRKHNVGFAPIQWDTRT